MFYRIDTGQKKIPKDKMTEENFDDISTQLESLISLHLLGLECGLAKSTAHVAVTLLKLSPYKTSRTQPFASRL
jgi:hypothetical protein